MDCETVRGSTTRGGPAALRGLARAARAGRDLAITPDGPKGPAEEVQLGAVWLAKLTGRPLLPVAFDCRPRPCVGSWDRIIVPLPFSRGAFEYGELLWIPRDADEETTEAGRVELQIRIRETTERARRRLDNIAR